MNPDPNHSHPLAASNPGPTPAPGHSPSQPQSAESVLPHLLSSLHALLRSADSEAKLQAQVSGLSSTLPQGGSYIQHQGLGLSSALQSPQGALRQQGTGVQGQGGAAPWPSAAAAARLAGARVIHARQQGSGTHTPEPILQRRARRSSRNGQVSGAAYMPGGGVQLVGSPPHITVIGMPPLQGQSLLSQLSEMSSSLSPSRAPPCPGQLSPVAVPGLVAAPSFSDTALPTAAQPRAADPVPPEGTALQVRLVETGLRRRGPGLQLLNIYPCGGC